MSTKPKLSVVCIAYNQELYIKETLDGFVAQKTNFPVEVIVADDYSSDGTAAIIAEYAKLHPGLIKPVLRKKNLGAINNTIESLKTAQGEYLALCEGDDYWTDPNKLQTQVDFLDAHKEYGGCFHVVDVVFSGTKGESYKFPDVTDSSWYTTDELLRTNYVPTNSVVYRRRKYDDLPNDVMPFDWYLHLYHSQNGPLAFIDKTMSVYRKHEAGLWWEYDKNRDEIWKKYGLSYLALHARTLVLFSGDEQKTSIIEQSIYTMLGLLIDIDQKSNTSLFAEAKALYPNLVDDFIIHQHKTIASKDADVAKLTAELLKVGDERNDLTIQLAATDKRLHEVVTSRAWRARTKLVVAKNKISRSKQG